MSFPDLLQEVAATMIVEDLESQKGLKPINQIFLFSDKVRFSRKRKLHNPDHVALQPSHQSSPVFREVMSTLISEPFKAIFDTFDAVHTVGFHLRFGSGHFLFLCLPRHPVEVL